MLKNRLGAVVIIVATLIVPVAANSAAAPGQRWVSEKGLFSVSYQSELDPVVINRIHSWTLFITDADGVAVKDARVTVEGGMPAHNHGLATAPVIEAGDGGFYNLQGLRFHMMGYWELTLTIVDDELTDKVVITLDL